MFNPASSQQTVSTVVSSFPSTSEPIVMHARISNSIVDFPATPIISAELTKGSRGVAGATVTALVSRPSYSAIVIELQDKGVGKKFIIPSPLGLSPYFFVTAVPDAYPNDGFYTSYFTEFVGNGRYNVMVKATADGHSARAIVVNPSHNLISNIEGPTIVSEDLEAFMRLEAAGVITVTNYSPRDMIPPARIVDLQAVYTDYQNQSVQFTWNSAGDDLYTGIGNFSRSLCNTLLGFY